MDNNPLVSILIPNYNKAPYLRETLDSIIVQTYTNWECIIVDDHSTDNSWEILEDYALKDSRFKIFKIPNHLPNGGNAARNYGFKMSKGEFVNWFDSDDYMKPEFIQLKMDYHKRGNYDAVISKMYKNENGNVVKTSWIPDFKNILEDYLVKDIHFTSPGPMISRKFLSGKKLFDLKIKVGQEKEFFFRLLCQGMKFIIIDEFLMVYFERKNSILDTFKKKPQSFESWRYRYEIINSVKRHKLDYTNYKSLINLWAFKILRLSLKELKLIVSFKMIIILTRNKLYV